jgi:aspartyl-tRNA(Asn)/glutamyl-tRNA(Gln) amidotransferase subunit A
MNELAFAPATELAARIAARDLSPTELVRLYLSRIDAHDGKLRGFLTVCRERALARAAEAEAEARAGRLRGPLHGVPIGLKDLFATAGVRTTAGSKILGDWIPERDAEVVGRLEAAGAIVLGKLHMHEFAYGPEGRNAHHGDP